MLNVLICSLLRNSFLKLTFFHFEKDFFSFFFLKIFLLGSEYFHLHLENSVLCPNAMAVYIETISVVVFNVHTHHCVS